MLPNLPSNTNTSLNLFDQVSQKLASIGCVPLTDYLYGFPSTAAAHPQQTLPAPPRNASIQQPSVQIISNPSVDTISANAISRLHHACQRTFGSIEPLKFEFIEEGGQRSNYLFSHLFIPTLIIGAQARNAY